MTTAQLTELRSLLARLYPTRDDARRLSSDLDIETARIDFSGSAELVWFRVLDELTKLNKLDLLLAQVRREYPDAIPADVSSAATRPNTVSTHSDDDDRPFDVFLSHNSKDKAVVTQLANALRARGLKPWLDAEQLVPGRRWQEALEEVIQTARSAAVLFGPAGLGPWEEPEMRACLSEFVDRRMSVIPVLLPGAPQKPELPLFLRAFTWVDLRRGLDEDGLGRLEWGIRGHKPGAKQDPPTTRIARPSADVALLAVMAELGEVAVVVADRLRRTPGATLLGPIDAADATRSSDVDRAALVVILLGGATGKTTVLADACSRRPAPVILKLKTPDVDAVDLDEWRVAKELRSTAADAPTFTTPTEAADHAIDATLAFLREHSAADPGQSPVLETWERAYLSVRMPQWERGRYGPLFARAQDQRLDRSQLYVPLRAETDLCWIDPESKLVIADKHQEQRERDPHTAETARRGRPDGDLAMPDRERRAPAYLEQALSHHGLPFLVIEGEAGAGKTVLLQHTAMVLASSLIGTKPPEHQLDLAAFTGDRPLPPIPIYLEARALARCLEQQRGIAGLHRAIVGELEAFSGSAIPLDGVRVGLETGRYLLLIDSLDETPGEEARREVVDLLTGYARCPNASRFVLTTRPSAYVGRVAFADPLRTVRISPLGDDEVKAMVARWCVANVCDAAYEHRLFGVIHELADRPGGANLAENPLLLTCTMLVYSQQERLPDSTAVLYQDIVDILCKRRVEGMAPEERRQLLEIVGYALQEAGGTELPVDAAARRLQEIRKGKYPLVDQARDALDRLAEDTGLLRFRSGRDARGLPVVLVQPWHRSFQEYLAACWLGAGAESVVQATDDLFVSEVNRSPRVEDPAWEGVLRFLVGVYGQSGFERARTYVERLHARVDDMKRKGRVIGLVASGLAEYRDQFDGHPLYDTLPAEIVARFRDDGAIWPLADRLLALEALGRLGDPRLREDPWVDIPKGSFEMGGDSRAYQSAPRHRVHLSGFKISWRPVTVEDFDPFVNQGSNESEWWSAGRDDFDRAEPDDWQRQIHHPNRPVTGVSWYAANAFCRWVTATGAPPWSPGKGHKVDLPTEAEWEYAARGARSDIYPWGGEEQEPGQGDEARANYAFAGSPMHPTPVGAFPLGNRKQGNGGAIVDLAGNVWEWCRDAWRQGDDSWREHDNPCHQGDAGSPRVVRGGSWNDVAGVLRAARRGRRGPGDRVRHFGFRVVCRGFPEHLDR